MTDPTEKDAEDVFAALMGESQPEAAAPEPEAAEPETMTEQATAEEPQAQTPPQDDVSQKLARLSEMEQHYTQLQRDYQAVHGRLAPMQRRVAELEHALKASSAAPANPPKPAPTDTGSPLPDVLKVLEEDYPQVADAFKASQRELTELKSRIEQMGSQFEPVARQVGFQTEVQRLTQAHPDWQDINDSDDFKGFVDWWWNNQPPAFRQAIGGDDGLAREFNRADFAIPLLNQFKEFKALRQPQRPAETPQRPQPNARAGQRAMSAAPNVRSAGLPPAVDMSALPEEDQFAMLMQQAGIR